jgi:hypothetical protein
MPPMRSPLPATLLLCVLAPLAPGGALPAQAKPACAAAAYRQFDFWVGDWTVTDPRGNVAGTNRIERILDGCVLQEHWVGSKGGSGTSLNMWNAAEGRWRQVWMDGTGSLLELRGGLDGVAMVMSGEHSTPGRAGGVTLERITWTPLAGGDVRQLWQSSTDGGATWTTQFDGRYVRKP